MPDDPTPALLYRLNQNIMVLGCAIEEISIRIDQRGSADTYDRVNEYLEVRADNSDAIAELIADLVARWKPQEKIDPED
jgi:hypothetical protein